VTHWWISNIGKLSRPLEVMQPELVQRSDASKTG